MNHSHTLCLLILLLTVVLSVDCTHAEPPRETATVGYRVVDGKDILLDVSRPAGDTICPVIVWIHGGTLINGGRESVPREVRQLAEEQAYALISIDYRLAPESKLPTIVSDVEAAFTWLARKGAKEFHFDPQRVVVCGGSAGGYLTLVTGYRAHPQPTALVALWGYGDLTGDWYATPSPHPRHNARKISQAEAEQQTDGSTISNASQRKGNGGLLYTYYRQNGLWPQLVSGFDKSELAVRIAEFEPLRNVTAEYPPTLLIHGKLDTDVPYEQSVNMFEQLKQSKVPVELVTIEAGEHGLAGGDPQQIAAAYQRMREFIIEHLSSN